METACVRHTELPNASKLFTDFVYHFHRVAPFYAGNPADVESYRTVAAKIHYPEPRRAALVAALREKNGENRSLDLLAKPGTLAVVTGQQVGLFSGPCYTIYKALTAVKLAYHLTSAGIPAVPVFWLATEDHDAEEVNHCWSFDAGLTPVSLRVNTDPFRQNPAGEIPLVDAPLSELRTSLAALPYGEDVAAIVEASYPTGRTLGAAFFDLLRRLLPDCVVFIDPMHPDIRALAAPVLREALAAGPDLIHEFQRRNRELESSGYHTQVHVETDTSLFFLLDGGRRIPLRRQDGGYKAGEKVLSTGELAGHAERLSPNALLRPVVQDHILPTVAHVAGPAEIAYLAQSNVAYQTLLGRMPVTVPRRAFTILDARAAKHMKRYGLGLDSFFHGVEAVGERISRSLVPGELQESIRKTTHSVAGQVDALRGQLAAFDPTLAAAADKSRSKILYQLSKIERKARREALRRDERASADAIYLSNLIYPHKHLQERFYTILPFLARHGLDFIDRLYENVHLDCPDHMLFAA